MKRLLFLIVLFQTACGTKFSGTTIESKKLSQAAKTDDVEVAEQGNIVSNIEKFVNEQCPQGGQIVESCIKFKAPLDSCETSDQNYEKKVVCDANATDDETEAQEVSEGEVDEYIVEGNESLNPPNPGSTKAPTRAPTPRRTSTPATGGVATSTRTPTAAPTSTATPTPVPSRTATAAPTKPPTPKPTTVPAPSLTNFAASPNKVTFGETFTFSWSSQNATECSITSSSGSYTRHGLPASGSLQSDPHRTTQTFYLQCKNSAGTRSSQRSARVEVGSPSITSVRYNGPANPSNIGSTFSLTIASQYTTRCELLSNSSFIKSLPTNGSDTWSFSNSGSFAVKVRCYGGNDGTKYVDRALTTFVVKAPATPVPTATSQPSTSCPSGYIRYADHLQCQPRINVPSQSPCYAGYTVCQAGCCPRY